MVYAPSVVTAQDVFAEHTTPKRNSLTANNKKAVIDRKPRPYIPLFDLGLRECHRGFTLSYLRRVPELAELARRVVVAEAKRRAKEQRKKGGEGRSQGSTTTSASLGSKMKRLFQWAVVQLLHEGSLILWDGPMRVCGDDAHGEVSGLWKTWTSISTSAEKSDLGLPGGTGHDGWDDGNLTEPAADEEGYMPVTSSFMAEYVEDVIRDLNGATKEAILRRLHGDDRWRFIGEWQVQDAVEHLRQESRAWRVGDKWALTS